MVRINAKKVRGFLLDMGWEQKDLARAAGVTEATVSRLLSGGPFTSDTLGKLATALQVNPVDLIDPAGYTAPHMEPPALLASVG